MAYCRWSSDFFECDAYVYEDVNGGWTTHIAGRRQKHKLPDRIKQMYADAAFGFGDMDFMIAGLRAADEAQDEWIKSFPHEVVWRFKTEQDGSIGKDEDFLLADSEYIDLATIGEEAGKTFSDPTPQDCARRLIALKEKGFLIPDWAIETLMSEQVETNER
jgi:hypothetical protein